MCKCILSPTATKLYACTLLMLFITFHINLSSHEGFTKQKHIYLWHQLPLDWCSPMIYSTWFKFAFLLCMFPPLLNSFAWWSVPPLADMCMHSSNPSQMRPSSFFCKCAYPTYDSCMLRSIFIFALKLCIYFSSRVIWIPVLIFYLFILCTCWSINKPNQLVR